MRRAVLAVALLLVCAASASAQESGTIKAYSKFDFVPGSQIIAYYDFSQDALGDFPEGWDTNASGEIVTIEGRPGHWLLFTKGGIFLPELGKPLPPNFTLEFDLLASDPFSTGIDFSVTIAELPNLKQPAAWQSADNRYSFTVHPAGTTNSERRIDGTGDPSLQAQAEPFAAKNNGVAHISVWRTKERVRVYLNDQKIWDVPKAMAAAGKYNSIIFWDYDVGPDFQYFLSNVRVAVGAPDARNRLLTEGKWVTHGILFDVNSDRIRGESYGTLKEAATVLKENPALNVRIIGYTDSDGDAAANLDLSKRRAAAVKSMLVSEFEIGAARLEADGRGASDPTDSNATATGKANNRRVEFVKM